jgi:hypothetical protein
LSDQTDPSSHLIAAEIEAEALFSTHLISAAGINIIEPSLPRTFEKYFQVGLVALVRIVLLGLVVQYKETLQLIYWKIVLCFITVFYFCFYLDSPAMIDS